MKRSRHATKQSHWTLSKISFLCLLVLTFGVWTIGPVYRLVCNSNQMSESSSQATKALVASEDKIVLAGPIKVPQVKKDLVLDYATIQKIVGREDSTLKAKLIVKHLEQFAGNYQRLVIVGRASYYNIASSGTTRADCRPMRDDSAHVAVPRHLKEVLFGLRGDFFPAHGKKSPATSGTSVLVADTGSFYKYGRLFDVPELFFKNKLDGQTDQVFCLVFDLDEVIDNYYNRTGRMVAHMK